MIIISSSSSNCSFNLSLQFKKTKGPSQFNGGGGGAEQFQVTMVKQHRLNLLLILTDTTRMKRR
jgi:hypothetical protein